MWHDPTLPLSPHQMCNFCTRECSIELVMFWLDVEHFRLFDGDQEDLKLLAQHIGELPVAVYLCMYIQMYVYTCVLSVRICMENTLFLCI